LKQVSVAPQLGAPFGTAIVWGVNANDDIYARSGVTSNSNGSAWSHVDGKLKYVHVAEGGLVIGVNAEEKVFRRVGVTAGNPLGTSWKELDGGGRLKQITIALQAGAPAGTGIAWGVNELDDIYIRTGITADSDGNNWEHVKDGKLSHVHVGPGGQVWGVNKAGNIFRREGISAQLPQGASWQAADGSLKQVSHAQHP